MPPIYAECYSICFSKKHESAALYFSRISTTELLQFATEHFSSSIADVLAREATNFSHLCWDIGYDISEHRGGSLDIQKAGIYGFL